MYRRHVHASLWTNSFLFFNEEASTSAGVFTSTLNIGPEGVLTSMLDANHRMCYKQSEPNRKTNLPLSVSANTRV